MSIYYEKQRGDLCRLHSLNAYYGFKKFDDSEFFKLCAEYDDEIKGLKTQVMDGFSEGRCIISYVLDKLDNKYVFLIPINSYKNARISLNLERYNLLIKHISCFFEFNKNHVWINKKIDKSWHKIDSISGVNRVDAPRIGKNGYLLVIDGKVLFNELEYLLNKIKLESDGSDNSNNNYNSNCNSLEIDLINLYYILKVINTDLNKHPISEEFSKYLFNLNKLKTELKEFIIKNRENKPISKEELIRLVKLVIS